MHQATKKPRLGTGSSRNIPVRNDDFGVWGDDLEVDDDVMQQIETQGYSQYPIYNTQKNTNGIPMSGKVSRPVPSTSREDNEFSTFQSELQTKRGEVKNLRMEMEQKVKDHFTQITEKNKEIAELRKQLSGKRSEIEFQKLEMKSQASKGKVTALSSPRLSVAKQPSNLNSSFHGRFSFCSVNPITTNEEKMFKFMKHFHQGDSLFKVLKCVLSMDIERLKMGDIENHDSDPEDNMFILKSLLWQLCRYNSFNEFNAHYLIKRILKHTNNLIMNLYKELADEYQEKSVNSKSQVFELNRMRDYTSTISPELLLKNKKLFTEESDVVLRQTLTIIAILIEIHPKTGEMIVETEKELAARCNCQSEIVDVQPTTSDGIGLDCGEKMETDQLSNSEGSNFMKDDFIFDFVEIMHGAVQDIVVKEKLPKYEGVLCSMFHVFSVLCSQKITIYKKQQVLIMSSIQKILFSLPGFHIIRYIIEFFAASSKYLFSDSLCCRSAAGTFIERFSCYHFTKDTCMLQVLCAYTEMMNRTPTLIDKYTSWLISCVMQPHEVRWISNQRNREFCECLLMVEQFTIRIMLSCIDIYNHNETTNSSKKLLLESLNRSILIFQRFRRRDSDFDFHILPCRGEYILLLRYLNEILRNEKTRKFVNLEYTFVDDNQRYNLSVETRNDLVKTLLPFSQDYHL